MPLFGPPNIEKLKAKRDVKGLTKALRHEDRNIRENAVKALGEMGHSSAIEPLLAPSQEDSPDVREAVVVALGKIGSTQAVEPLTAALRDTNGRVRWTARVALDKIGWKPGTDDTAAWYWAAKADWSQCLALGARAVEPLIAALRDKYFGPDTYVRYSTVKDENLARVAETLGQIGDRRAVAPLLDALKDTSNSRAREKAAAALGQIGDARAAEPLVKAIEDSTDSNFSQTVVEALGRVGDTQTARLLIDAFKQSEELSSIRSWVTAQALIKIGPAAVGPLIDALNDTNIKWSSVREMAANVLGTIGDARAVEPLSAALSDGNESLCKIVVTALDKFGWKPGSDKRAARYWIAKRDWQRCVALGDTAVESLLAECRSTRYLDFQGYKAAVDALGQIAAPRALPPLVEMLQNDHHERRQLVIVRNLAFFDAYTVLPAVTDLLLSGGVVVRRRIAGLFLDMCLADMCQDTPTRLDAFAVDLLARRFEDTQLTTAQQARLAGLIQQLQPDHPVAAKGKTLFDLHSAALSARPVAADRAAAAEVIASFGARDAEARILDVIDGEKSPDVLKWLAEGLGYCGSGKPAVNKLIGLLDIDQSKVRRKVADALAALGDPAAVGPLERTMESKAKTAKVKGYHAMTQAVDILKYI